MLKEWKWYYFVDYFIVGRDLNKKKKKNAWPIHLSQTSRIWLIWFDLIWFSSELVKKIPEPNQLEPIKLIGSNSFLP